MQNVLSLNPPISIFRPIILKRKFNLKVFWILSLFLIGSLLAFYIFQVHSIVQNTYLLSNSQQKIERLSEENKKLEIEFAGLDSLENLANLIQNLNYEKIDKIKYIQILEGEIVSK